MPKSLWDSVKLLWRAVTTRTGLTAIGFAVVGVARLERIITLAVDDPKLAEFLHPWINNVLIFAAGVLIWRAIENEIRLSHVIDYMPARDLIPFARKWGWDLDGPNSLEILDLGNAMQQSGLDGTLTIYGRNGQRQFPEMYGPLNKIPPEHWATFDVYSMAMLMSDDNADVESKNITQDQRGFFDLHVDRRPALWWLRNVAPKERGKRAKAEVGRDARIAENQRIIELERAERARGEPPPSGPGSWMG
jgi:hypothetical protein